jgi:hypothetical protein
LCHNSQISVLFDPFENWKISDDDDDDDDDEDTGKED